MTLELREVSVRRGERLLLREVVASVEPGVVALAGPNGAGKTSLLRALAGVWGYEGEVRWRGKALKAMRLSERVAKIAYVPQQSECAWEMSVAQVVALGGKRVAEALEAFGLEGLAERPVSALSGGERQRVMLARAVAGEPEVLLLDEPVAAQDPAWQRRIMAFLQSWAGEERLVVAVLHDLALASFWCNQALILADGRLRYAGEAHCIFTLETVREIWDVDAVVIEKQGRNCIIPL